jgi:hypothetical protein
MANSTSANLKLTVQATGENSGTWGQITNTNLLILEQAIGGYSSVALNATTGATLTYSNGALSNGKDAVIKLTGTITASVNVVIPDSVEKTYIIENATSGAFTVTVKTSSGTGVTWSATDKGKKMVYSDGTNIVDTAFTEVSSDYSPQLSGILDTNGNDIIIDNGGAVEDDSNNEYVKFVKTATAVNEVSITNAAASTGPEISATGDDTNIDLKLTPKGSGNLVFDGIKFPNADGTVDQILVTDGAGNLSFTDNSGGTSWQAVITADPANAVAGNGYFCDTSGGAFTVTLPTSPTLGDEVTLVDYAGTFDTNNLTVGRNSENIQGTAADLTVSVERAGLTLVYSGATQGWLLKDK